MQLNSSDKAIIIAAVIDVVKPELSDILSKVSPIKKDSLPEVAEIIATICQHVIDRCEKQIP